MRVVVVYDVRDNRRRKRLHTLLKGYGQWQQYSVFECELSQKKYFELVSRVKYIIDESEDSVLFYKLCAMCVTQTQSIGTAILYEEEEVLVI
ncbi:MAG TPA: CRISPR-associated endonuclease Cas2 [Spirochaetota bacterium]|nr:CRISPR-associated endonuclease Cas2 [Spirochaetota bacterium]